MVAISILTVGFLGITTLLTKSFQLNRVASDQTKATYLAAEGIEIAKNLIDHDVFSGIATVGGWGTCFSSSSSYYQLDYTTTDCSLIPFSPVPNPAAVYFDSVTGLYSDSPVGAGSTKTIFTRDVRVDHKGDEIDVYSTVYWNPTSLSARRMTLEDHFYNWHPLTN